MGFRTDPDRILENIDRARSREEERRVGQDRQASGREMDADVPDSDATTPERLKRIFRLVEQAYMTAAASEQLGPLAARFRTIGDIPEHNARGDLAVSVQYLDSKRNDDVGVIPIEINADQLVEARKVTKTTRPDVNAMKVLRDELRDGVLAAYKKIEPRIRDAIRERADIGHVAAEVTVDLRALD